METFFEKLKALLALIGVDFVFLIPLAIGLVIIAAAKRPAFAVLKRNFLAYFTNPTGYVFLCLFVALSSITAFWGDGFFNANLASLDQLNQYLPLIMLVFIPAITMSIWSDERRLGTDELLLTMPATDFDIVLGKYLAAVAIYTVSLLFSQVCNFLVLISLGNPDTGLFLGNYFGYWMVGLAMLAIGMVASFMTRNLTVGFILGIVFCLPLVVASWANVVFPDEFARKISQFSVAAKFYDFQSGVISSSSLIYFVMVIVVMLYLSMVLIGRRHWSAGRVGAAMGGHFAVRVVALIVIAASVSVAASAVQAFRWDVTSEKLSSLSPESLKLVKEATSSEEPFVMKVEAFISKDLPEEYVQKRFNLLSALQEIKATGGDRIKLRIYDGIDIFGEQATRAKVKYGIEKETTQTTVRGAPTTRDVIFGVAFEYGLERKVVPFMGESLPVEYELMHLLATAAQDQKKRKTVGVLETDARLMSGGGRDGSSEQPLIEELKKQYDVQAVNPSEPITQKYDVLLAVQPSSLDPQQMDNFVEAVKGGQATAIFEDPFPYATGGVAGTDQPKQAQQQSPFMRQPPSQKGDIKKLWNVLGIKLVTGQAAASSSRFPFSAGPAAILFQDYTPHPDTRAFMTNEFVWITPSCNEAGQPISANHRISSNLQALLFLYAGGIETDGEVVNRDFTTLVSTGPRAGKVRYSDCVTTDMFGRRIPRQSREEMIEFEKRSAEAEFVLAAAIHIGARKGSGSNGEEGAAEESENNDINAIVVADIDVLSGVFFLLRENASLFGEQAGKWELDNVTFVLNIVDDLADDARFMEIRKRRRQHRELTAIKRLEDDARRNRNRARKDAEEKFKKTIEKEQDKIQQVAKDLGIRDVYNMTPRQQEELKIATKDASDRVDVKRAQLDRAEKDEYRRIENNMSADIHRVQNNYKLLAVLLPPIPPLFIAICVFFVRRSREKESVVASRLR